MVMTSADHGWPGPDHYQLLGVPRQASREEIAQAWRRRARDEHPDARPADAGAASRFRALADAWHVLGDPDRRAAYDRALASPPQPAARVRVTVRGAPGSGGPGGITPGVRVPAPPLRAGPIQVDGGPAARTVHDHDERDARLAILAHLALRYLARNRDWPW
jgi:curved DNA-binding protein CbpA